MSKLMELADTWAKGYAMHSKEGDEARAALAAEIEKLERDAARYRWLKGSGKAMAVDNFKDKFRVVDVTVNLVVTEWEDSFDVAIDAAMEATNG